MNLKQLALAVVIAAGAAACHHQAEPVAQTAAPASQRQSLPDFHSIVEQFGAAVVNVSTEGKAEMHGLGSGFIVSPDGVILTNAHVVDGAAEVTVKLTDRREFRAKVLGVDPLTDIAVLRIEAKNLPVVRLGDPASLRTGDWVLAIGAPFGFENSVTAGIVSAKGRSLPGDGYVPFIQSDVAVNPGNSGGPLFNLAGEVVGITSQIYSGSGGYQGISFAIPADVAARVERQIVAQGHATHARLGVQIQGLNTELAGSFGLKTPNGALVASIVPGSAAARAGLQPGDVILKANGTPISDSGDLPALVERAAPGDKLALEVWRNGAAREMAATLGAAEQVTTAAVDAKPDRLGLTVHPAGSGGGLMVDEAVGAAARAGIQQGDIVLAVNGAPVRSVEALRGVLAGAKGVVAVLIRRDDATIYVPVRVG